MKSQGLRHSELVMAGLRRSPGVQAQKRIAAAAPDMLAALKAVEEWWLGEEMSRHTGAPYAIFATRAAIAKATGQP